MNRDTRAFTLIELLVVISIVALLIALLLPSLTHARNTARLVLCGTQQRQLNVAMNSYANDFEGRPAKFDSGRGTLAPGQLFTSYSAHPHTIIQQNSAANADRRVVNHGIWMQDGRVTPDVFFCPDLDFEDANGVDTLKEQEQRFKGPLWELLVSGGHQGYSGVQVRNFVSIGFNTLINWHTRWRGGDMDGKLEGFKLWQLDSSFPVTFDSRSWSSPRMSFHDGRGYNVAYGDGSVQFLDTPALIETGIRVQQQIGGNFLYTQYWKGRNLMPLNPYDERDFAGDYNLMDTWKIMVNASPHYRWTRYGKIIEVFRRIRDY